MGPDGAEEEIGFSGALGSFDSVIDTLGDEANFDKFYLSNVLSPPPVDTTFFRPIAYLGIF
jgi:hypothetical protein